MKAQLTEPVRQIAGGTCGWARPLHQEAIRLVDSVCLLREFFHEVAEFGEDEFFHREADGVF